MRLHWLRCAPHVVCSTALLLQPGCAASVVSRTESVLVGPSRLVETGPAKPVATHIRAVGSWSETPEQVELFGFSAVEESTCEVVEVREQKQVEVVERKPASLSKLLFQYAVGAAGLAMVAAGTYRYVAHDEPFDKPAPTTEKPDETALTRATLLTFYGSLLMAALVPALMTTAQLRDLETPLPPYRERKTVQQPCGPARPLAQRKVELVSEGLRYPFTTDSRGKAQVELGALSQLASPDPGVLLPTAFLDGREQPDLAVLVPTMASRLHRASEELNEGCARGTFTDCRRLGDAYARGQWVAADATRAVSLYGRACAGGDAPGCFELGRARSLGMGVTRDPAQAVRPFEQACDHGEPRACTALGYILQQGDGVAVDQKRALALYERACREHDPVACYNLARQYTQGRGVERSFERAAALYASACDGGMAPSCHNLALLVAKGQGVARDEVRAQALFEKSCAGGYAASCDALAGPSLPSP